MNRHQRTRQRQAFESWLRAEHSGRDKDAERALHALFQDLPEPRPRLAWHRPSFRRRVLAEAGVRPAPPRTSVEAMSWPLRWATACLLLLAGLSLAASPLLLAAVAGQLSLSGLLDAAVLAFFDVVSGLASMAGWWSFGESLYRAFLLTVLQPPVLLASLACALFSAAGLRWLGHLLSLKRLSLERSVPHVAAH